MPDLRVPPWLTFAAISLLFFLVNAGTFNSLGVVLPAMVGELHWTWTLAGAGFTILGLTCGLSSFVPAMLIRRLGVRSVMICGTLLLMVGFVILAKVHGGATYLFATALLGIAFSLAGTVAGTHVVTGLFKRRSTVLGAYFTIGALGGFAGPLLYVGVHAATGGWRVFWMVFVAASALVGGLAIATTPGRREPELAGEVPPGRLDPVEMVRGLRDWTVRRALATPQFYVIVGAYSMYLLINTTTHGFAVEHLTERGVDSRAAAAMLSLEALVGAGVAIVGGVAGEKVSPKRLMIVALTATAVGMAGLAEARGWGLMLVYALGMGTGFGLSFLASTMLLLNYFGKRANLELYSIMSVISTSAAAGPAFGGWVRDAAGSFTGMFLLCAGAVVAMLLATCFLTPPDIDAARKGRGPRRGDLGSAEDAGKVVPS